MGNNVVWKKQVNDTYMFAAGPDAKNINFTISENDKVIFKIEDIDVLYHDFIAQWQFPTSDKKPGTWYNYDKAKGNIKSCFLRFKID